MQDVALLQDRPLTWQQRLAEPGYERDPGVGRRLERADLFAEPFVTAAELREYQRSGRIAPQRRHALWEQPAQHLISRPAHGRDGRNAEPLIDLGAAGVVDSGGDALYAERLSRDPRGDDVRVVAAAHGGEGMSFLDAGLDQHVAVEPDARDLAPPEAGP